MTPSPVRSWVPNFAALVLAHFLFFVAIQLAQPFMPLYLRDVGATEGEAIVWTGLMLSIGGIIMVFTQPYWGLLGDKFGQKSNFMRGMLASAVVFVFLGFATAPWHVFILRLLQSLFGGAVPAVISIAAQTLPTSRLAMGMGVLQSAQSVGISIGPSIGGLLASAIGIRTTFFIGGAALFVAAVLGFILVKEPPKRAQNAQKPLPLKQSLSLVWRTAGLRNPILAIWFSQTALFTSVQLLPLHIHQIAPVDATATVGFVVTAYALGTAFGSVAAGWLSSRLGVDRVAVGTMLISAVLSVPQFWITDPTYFMLIRLVIGFTSAGVLPMFQSMLGRNSKGNAEAEASIGSIYSFGQSAYQGGLGFGAAVSSLSASLLGIPSIHLVCAAILAATGVWWMVQSRQRIAAVA